MSSRIQNPILTETQTCHLGKRKFESFNRDSFIKGVEAAKNGLGILFPLKKEQLEVLEALVLGRDVLCNLPTGR